MDNINVFKDSYKGKLQKAYVTNTRLMGVIGVIGYYENFVDIYHLDFEEYGIDGFYRINNEDKMLIERKINNTIGGLGGELKEITEKEYKYLLKKSFDINQEYINLFDPLNNAFNEIENLNIDLSNGEIEKINSKILVDLKNEYELINYYIMRKVGKDKIYKYLEKKDSHIDFKMTNKPYTLLKNDIKKIGEEYLCESLIDFKHKYMIMTSVIRLEDNKIINARIKEKLEITSIEASFILNKKEYILIYHFEDLDFIEEFLDDHNRLMRNEYDNGILYTEYNKNNNHVSKKTYFLSDDIYGIYYFTDSNQLVVSSFKEKNIEKIIRQLEKYKTLNLNDDFVIDQSLIYSFISSKYNDFYDFLNLESRD